MQNISPHFKLMNMNFYFNMNPNDIPKLYYIKSLSQIKIIKSESLSLESMYIVFIKNIGFTIPTQSNFVNSKFSYKISKNIKSNNNNIKAGICRSLFSCIVVHTLNTGNSFEFIKAITSLRKILSIKLIDSSKISFNKKPNKNIDFFILLSSIIIIF